MEAKLQRRKVMKALGAGAMAASGLVPARAVFAQSSETIKLTSVLSNSGFFAQYGLELTRGLQIAVEAVNQKGLQIGGKTYNLKYEIMDDKSDASTSARLVERAINDGANFVIAAIGSLIGKAIIPVAQRMRVPVMAQWAQLDNVFMSQKGNPYFFSTMPPFSTAYDSNFEQLSKLDNPKPKKVVMISPNDELGALVAKTIPDTLKKNGMELTHVEFFPPGTQDFSAALDRCARQKPDAFLINCYTPQILAIFKQMQSVRFLPAVIIVEAPTTLVEGLGKAADGMFYPSFWSPDVANTKDEYIGTSKDFARLYNDKFKTMPPDFVAACGANNIVTYAKAVASAKAPNDTSGVLNALRKFEGETFFSKIKFNDFGMNVRTAPYTAQFQNGKAVLTWPQEWRQSAPVHPYPGWNKA